MGSSLRFQHLLVHHRHQQPVQVLSSAAVVAQPLCWPLAAVHLALVPAAQEEEQVQQQQEGVLSQECPGALQGGLHLQLVVV
jgi:hypothetical protein